MNQPFQHGYALLIGVDQHTVGRLALPVVKNDVAALAAVLVDPEVCAYPKENVRTVTGQAATRQGIFDGLDWLRARLDADTSGQATAVVYYSGHGWRDTRGGGADHYLIPYDVDMQRPDRSALRAADFARELKRLAPRRLLVILDCCHAHGMGAKDLDAAGYSSAPFPIDALDPVLASGPDAEPMIGAATTSGGDKGLESLRQGEGRVVLSSSRGHERSYFFEDGRMSIFTHHLIEALTGHASTSAGQSEVLVSDVLGYLPRTVRDSAQRERARPQNPDFRASGNFAIAMLLGGKGLAAGREAPQVADVVSRARRQTGHSFGEMAHSQVMVGDHNTQVGDVRASGPVAIGAGNTITTHGRGKP